MSATCATCLDTGLQSTTTYYPPGADLATATRSFTTVGFCTCPAAERWRDRVPSTLAAASAAASARPPEAGPEATPDA